MTDYPGYLYSVLIAGGGVAGYMTAGSTMALVMGLVFGLLAALGAHRCSVSSDQYLLGLLVSVAMLGRFGHSWYKSGQVMYGVVAVVSLFMVIRYIVAATSATKKSA